MKEEKTKINLSEIFIFFIFLIMVFIFSIILLLSVYQPVYKVSINNNFVGYYKDQKQFNEVFDKLVDEKKSIHPNSKIYVDQNPKFERMFVKQTAIDNINLYSNLRSLLKAEYTIYLVQTAEKEKMYFEDIKIAKEYQEKISKQAYNVKSEVKEIKISELDQLTNREQANAILKGIISRSKPLPPPPPPKPVEKPKPRPTPSSTYGCWPTKSRYISCPFAGYRGHTGMDIAGRAGDPNKAYQNGKVIFAGWAGPYGYLVKLEHGNGIQSWYAHNSKILVRVGQYVSKGQTIALQGSTGNSTGPHLHFEIRIKGRPVNPHSYIR